MATATHAPRRFPWQRVLQGLLLVWAAFWIWFVVAGHWSEIGTGWPYILGGLATIALVTFTALRWPVVGGALLVLAGIGAAVFFDHTFARLALALPMVALGMGISMCPTGPGSRT